MKKPEKKQLVQNNLAKAREISDASDQMAADAQDFASMAKQLADGENGSHPEGGNEFGTKQVRQDRSVCVVIAITMT